VVTTLGAGAQRREKDRKREVVKREEEDAKGESRVVVS